MLRHFRRAAGSRFKNLLSAKQVRQLSNAGSTTKEPNAASATNADTVAHNGAMLGGSWMSMWNLPTFLLPPLPKLAAGAKPSPPTQIYVSLFNDSTSAPRAANPVIRDDESMRLGLAIALTEALSFNPANTTTSLQFFTMAKQLVGVAARLPVEQMEPRGLRWHVNGTQVASTRKDERGQPLVGLELEVWKFTESADPKRVWSDVLHVSPALQGNQVSFQVEKAVTGALADAGLLQPFSTKDGYGQIRPVWPAADASAFLSSGVWLTSTTACNILSRDTLVHPEVYFQHATRLLRQVESWCRVPAQFEELAQGRSLGQILFLPRLYLLTLLLAGVRLRLPIVAKYSPMLEQLFATLLEGKSEAELRKLDEWDRNLVLLLPRLYNEVQHLDLRPLPKYIEAFGTLPEEARKSLAWVRSRTMAPAVTQFVHNFGIERPDYNQWVTETMLGLDRHPDKVLRRWSSA